jgi:uncharacterized membrane protein
MNQIDYLDALKRAMAGLPPETIAKTLGYYEQRFIDELATGRSEEQIAAELGDPKKIAITLRASAHMAAFEQKRNPGNALRLVVSLVGLAIFNLFMVVPAIVFTALLGTMYACAFAFYLSGIAITASGLAGANDLVLDGPLKEWIMDSDSANSTVQTKISISNDGIQFYQEPAPDAVKTVSDDDKPKSDATGKVIKQAESVVGRGLRVTTGMDAESRATQSLFGLGIVVGGILLFLLGLVVTRYTLIGVKRYAAMNFSLLRGH